MKCDINRFAPLLALCLVIGLAGCKQHEPAYSAKQAETASPVRERNAGAEHVQGGKPSRKPESAWSGKPGAPVALSYDYPSKPAIGELLQIPLHFTVAEPSPLLQVACTAGEGLVLRNARFNFEDLAAGEAGTHVIQVIPQTEGMHYVNVVVQMKTGGGNTARTFAVPVEVGHISSQTRKQEGTLTKDEAGESIISLPAD